MTELHLGSKHLSAGTNSPGNDGLGNLTSPNGFNNTVLLNTTNFTEKDEHLAIRICFIAEEVVNESRTWITITTNSDTLIGAIRDEGKDVVQLIGHATRLRDIANRTRAVELGCNDVVHHTTRVTNPEATRLDTTNGSRTDDEDTLLFGRPENLTSVALRNTLSDKSDSLDLGVLKAFEGTRIHTTARSKIDNNIDIGMLGSCLLDTGVDGEKSLFGTPVEFLNVMTTKGVYHSSNGGCFTAARVIKIKHALNSTRLETVDKGAGLSIKRPEPRTSGRRLAGLKVDDLVLGLSTTTIRVDRADSRLITTNRSDLRRWGDWLKMSRRRLGFRDIDPQSKRHDLGDMGVGTKDTDGNAKALTKEAHSLETFLVIGSAATDENLDIVADELVLVFFEGANDTLESSRNICKIGNTTTNDENLAIRTRSSPSDQIDLLMRCQQIVCIDIAEEFTNGLCIFVSLTLSGSTRILPIVGELISITVSGNSVRVDNTGTTTGNHGPDSTLSIENSQFQGSTGRTVKFLNISLFLGQVTTKRGRPDLQLCQRLKSQEQTRQNTKRKLNQ